MDKAKIDRINELGRIAKERELTEAEIAERAALREEYLRDFRASFGKVLENTVIQYPDGSRESLDERKNKKKD